MSATISNHICKRCGTPIPYDRHRVFCDACNRLNRREALLRERTCIDCGKTFYGFPKSKRCPECQSEANKRNDAEAHRRKAAGNSRRIGDKYKCEICGKKYVLTSGRQRYCPDCARIGAKAADAAKSRAYSAAHREEINDRRRAGRVCIICGKPITSKSCTVTCGDQTCRATRKAQMQKAADARRKGLCVDDNYKITKNTGGRKHDIH